MLAARIEFKGEELPLRSAQAKLAVLDAYADREELGSVFADANAAFNPERLDLLSTIEALEAEITGEPDVVARTDGEKGISLRELERALAAASETTTAAYEALRDRWFERLLGPERDEVPSSSHVHYLRRLSPLEATYPKDRCVEVCLATLGQLGFDMAAQPGIRLDLDDRPQKSPRACVIASDPPQVVHLITRAQGGVHDYQAFLHEAGHALHYAGCDPALPYTFRKLSRDHALTEIYSYILESISREPGWHAEHFGLSDEEAVRNADATTFLEAMLYRRYAAKLRFELDFWTRFPAEGGGSPAGYSEGLTAATGIRYRADQYLSDMDAGFYSADYLRAWIRSPQLADHLRREVGEQLVAPPRDRRAAARALRRGHPAALGGHGRAARLRPARHRPARGRAQPLSFAWISRVSAATCSVSSLSACVNLVLFSSSLRSSATADSSRASISSCRLSASVANFLSRSACRVAASRISGAA